MDMSKRVLWVIPIPEKDEFVINMPSDSKFIGFTKREHYEIQKDERVKKDVLLYSSDIDSSPVKFKFILAKEGTHFPITSYYLGTVHFGPPIYTRYLFQAGIVMDPPPTKQYMLKKWYPSLPKEFKEGTAVIRFSGDDDYVSCDESVPFSINSDEVESNPEYWKQIVKDSKDE